MYASYFLGNGNNNGTKIDKKINNKQINYPFFLIQK